jgi:Putative esterase
MAEKYLRGARRQAGTAALLPILLICALASPMMQHTASAATIVSDDFNRADGALESNWTTVSGTAAPTISSDTLQAGTPGVLNSAYWSANTFSSDQYAQASLPNSSGTQYGPGIAVRLSNSTGYLLWYGNTPDTVSIWRMDSSTSWTQLAQSATLTTSSTDIWKITAVGSTISGYQNGKLVVQTTDTNYTSGSPGVWLYFAANQITNWSGGDMTYSVGGTLSGLSGTATSDGSGSGSGTSASDDFNRADGPLGGDWTDMSDGGLTITSDAIAGSSAGNSGDIRTAESYGSDQYSQIQLTATAIGGDEWIGPSVRSQNGGQNDYVGIYFGNYGNPELMLFKRLSGNWTQLGQSYASGTLPAGTTLKLTVQGSTISFLEDGAAVITVTDTSLNGGAPGIMAYGTAHADNWSGGDMPALPSYTVGGTIAGTNGGTATLEDNGGDAISLTEDGSFAFPTAVTSGSPYNVTVLLSPDGETCAVTNGSGTIGSMNVANVTIVCTADANGSASDDFNRANGSLGGNWTDDTDAGMTISSQVIVGTQGASTSGDMRTAEAYNNNQFSQIQVTSTQLTGSQWIGPAVRMSNGGQDGYAGIYYWNNGNPELMLFERTGTTWVQLGDSYFTSPLAAGATLKLEVVGTTLSFLVNGVERVAAYDNEYASGAPGIMMYGTGQADNWSGGTAGFEVHYLSTDFSGIETYDIISANNGYGPQVLRVLNPTDPAPGVAHNFLFVLPVETGTNDQYGDPMQVLESLNAQNQYNLTIVEPTFVLYPWYADNPDDAQEQYETFMTKELAPWVDSHLATTGSEQNWLIGFSKSGLGGQDLILKHPDLFALAASWDFPADMPSYDYFGSVTEDAYGTDANYQANYRLTQAFVDAHKAPFVNSNRIWIGGYQAYQADDSDYDALLTSEGIEHTTETPTYMAHRWDSGWVPLALAALYQDSLNMQN